MEYSLKQYTNKSYSQLADEFESYFLRDQFKTSAENLLRDRYEVRIPEVDHWINSLGFGLENFGTLHGNKFKSGLFAALKKCGWSTTNIPGRWKKVVYK